MQRQVATVSSFPTPYGPVVVSRCRGPARMGWHRHVRPHLVAVLAGTLWEGDQQNDGSRLDPGQVKLMPAGTRHRSWFGAGDSLLMSLRIVRGADKALGLSRWPSGCRWSIDEPLRARLAAAAQCHEAGGLADVLDALDAALLAAHGADPPEWLERIRRGICDSPEDSRAVADWARGAARHPAHLSERFAGAFGVGPSLFRQRARLRRAVMEMSGGGSITDAAFAAGFADSAHLARTLRRFGGTTAGRLQRLQILCREVALGRSPAG